jgi:hypothetical protein
MRLQGYHISGQAIDQHITVLLKDPDQPALALLRRSAPQWWRAMLLGPDNSIAMDLLTSKGFTLKGIQPLPEREERYSVSCLHRSS